MSSPSINTSLLDAIKWNEHGLLPAIAQDSVSNDVLMLAWMNRDALLLTLETGLAHYWSRSRQALWKKGETSGHLQEVKALRLDCDGDTLLLKVIQVGGIACHTGRANCFFYVPIEGHWVASEPVLTSPGKFNASDS